MGIFLIMGAAPVLASSKCKEVVALLEEQGLEVERCSLPTSLKAMANAYSHVLLMADQSAPPPAEAWGAFFKKSPKLDCVALVQGEVPASFQKLFKFQHQWSFENGASDPGFLAWVKQTFSNIPAGYESVTAMGGDPELEVLPASASEISIAQADSSIEINGLEDDGLLGALAVESSENVLVAEEIPSGDVGDFADILNDSGMPVADAALDSLSAADSDDAENLLGVAGDDSEVLSGSILGTAGSEMKDLSDAPALSSAEELPDAGGESTDSQSAQVIKRYALLKEKENREKQKTIDILRSELEKAKVTLHSIQSEKRRVMLKVEDLEADRRALQETVDELRHKLALSDGETSQKIRDYQTRLENSQFVAKRFEKKLEDFKLRVRLDIQKIRARERELENRLELQKRDAEALLSTKDSRLLNQKREIDKLQFEMEILKERLVEETERAEDRNEKLHRASQSLKMAQGMLSGIDEGVISTSERDSEDDSGGEAA